MSDEEIRDLLDLGAADYEFGPPIEADETWAAGRRTHTRRSWGVGLGAVAAAAAVVGVVWTQGLGGGDVAPAPPQPADGTLTGPTQLGTPPVTEAPTGTATDPRGEPFLAQFEKADNEAPFQLSGASEPATLDDLQGTWKGPYGEVFSIKENTLTVDTGPPCHEGGSHTVDITAEGRLILLDSTGWEVMDCAAYDEGRTAWREAIRQEPLLSLDGETLLISGLDGISEESRVPASLTLGAVDEAGFIWEDRPSRTDVAPVALGDDFQLMVSAAAEDMTLTHISELNLESPGLCGQVMASSLRSDGILLAGAAAPWPVCSQGEDALPPAEPPPAVVALLQSAPTVTFEDDTMVITGTVPESSLGQGLELVPDDSTATHDDSVATSEPPEQGAEDPPVSGDLPAVAGTPQLIVMSEGDWAPTGELAPLTAAEVEGRRWFQVEADHPAPTLPGGPGYGLDFDGSSVHVRFCGVDVTVAGSVQDGLFRDSGGVDVVDDPDPGIDCPSLLAPTEWVQVLTNEPRMSTDGEILVISGGVGDVQLEPVSMAMSLQGTPTSTDPIGLRLTPEALAMGLAELPESEALSEGLDDVRDPQPEHTTILSVEDGVVRVDVGCSEPLQGPVWYSHVGPEDVHWQLTAALPEAPDCAGSAAADAELWRQMLAHGVFLFPFEGNRIVDSWAEPAPPG